MSAVDFLATVRRRWYVLTFVALCTAAGLWAVRARPITYQGCEVLRTSVPARFVTPNTDGALTTVAGMVTETMISQPVRQRILSEGIADYTVTQSSIGDIRFPTYADELRYQAAIYPAVLACAMSRNPRAVIEATSVLTTDFQTLLRQAQMDQHVPVKSAITADVVTSTVPLPILGVPAEAYLGVVAIGIISGVVLVVWSDSLLVRLSSRHRHET
jgi:hypothetical protein